MRRYTDTYEGRRRKLPHYEQAGATYFLTLRRHRDACVDLTRPALGRLIVGALRHFDDLRYWLHDYTVMPDHMHVILKPLTVENRAVSLSRIMHSLKSWTAHEANRALRRTGPLWQAESYDRILETERDYEAAAEYILHNARLRGLVAEPTEWPWWGKGSGPR